MIKSLTQQPRSTDKWTLKRHKNLDKIVVNLQDGLKIIKVEDITFCEANANYTIIHRIDQKSVLVSKTLKHFDKVLKDRFIRIHQSYLVNMDHISGFGAVLELENGIKLPISRSKRNQVHDLIKRKYIVI